MAVGSEQEANLTCPRCKQKVPNLLKVDPGMKLRLQGAGLGDKAPESVCQRCFSELGVQLNQGAKLRAEQNMREQNRLILWKNRVNLIKQAKLAMERKAFSEAAVLYEKYLRVIEIVYEVKPGELGPDVFSNTARLKELTVISSVYWDLFRIYDSSPRYGERQKSTLKKLAGFIQRSMIGEEIVNQAQRFKATAKNPQMVDELLKLAKVKQSRCFVASASFDPHLNWELDTFYEFRSQVLSRHMLGRVFIEAYYFLAPFPAKIIERSPTAKRLSRALLRRCALRLLKSFNLQRPSHF